jgi:peroxiredoxin
MLQATRKNYFRSQYLFMKHYLFIIAAVLLFSSCKEDVRINGHIKNMPKQTLILEDMSLDKPVFVDSTTSTEDGSFSLSLNSTDEKLYRLSFISNRYIMLALTNGDQLQLDADWNNLENYQVSGSQKSTILKSFIMGTRSSIVSLNTMQMIVDTFKQRGSSDSVLAAAQDALALENTKFMDFMKKFADTTTSVTAALMAVNAINPNYEGPFIKAFYEKIETRFPESTMAKAYKDHFNGAATNDEKPSIVKSGEPAPDFTLKNVDGQTVTLSSFRGQYVLVDFWASWCKPCRAENPTVVAAYKKYKEKNFTVLGISLDTDKNSWKKAIETDGLSWTHLSDLLGFGSPVAQLYKVNSIPANILIDPNGNIVAKDLRGDNLLNTLETTLK